MKKGTILEQIEITDIADQGLAVGRCDSQVIFVKGAVPGDIVNIAVTRHKRNFTEGKVVQVLQKSQHRQEPFCSYFGTCGGCRWQNLSYKQQLFFKQKQVQESLSRIAKIEVDEILPIIPSDLTQYYRNKLEFTFSSRAWLTEEQIKQENEVIERRALGFHLPRHFDRVLGIDECYLQPKLSNEIRNSARDFGLKNNYSFYDARLQEGFLRNLLIRNTLDGQWMVIVVFGFEDEEKREYLLEHLRLKFPDMTSLMYIINIKRNDSLSDQTAILHSGSPFITETLCGQKFRIGATSFFQTNPSQAEKLYSKAIDFASINPDNLVYDLYTGTGSIALCAAVKARKVVGIEYVDASVEDARNNALLNNIANAVFVAGDLAKVLNQEFVVTNGRPDVIITDPPRSGMHPDVVKQILQIAPDRIVYVSCNPATQARDIALLKEKYDIVHVQPVDMFPHTEHVENIVSMAHR